MVKPKHTPRYKVISMRVSDTERQMIQKIAQRNNMSISKMMRQAMDLFTDNRFDTHMGHTA
jgi:predicted transcriptional regulator